MTTLYKIHLSNVHTVVSHRTDPSYIHPVPTGMPETNTGQVMVSKQEASLFFSVVQEYCTLTCSLCLCKITRALTYS